MDLGIAPVRQCRRTRHRPPRRGEKCHINAPRRPKLAAFLPRRAADGGYFCPGATQNPSISAPAASVESPTASDVRRSERRLFSLIVSAPEGTWAQPKETACT